MLDLFADEAPWSEPLVEGAVVLRRWALSAAPDLLATVADIAAQAPFQHRITPGGHRMSVAMTHCGPPVWSLSTAENGSAAPGWVPVPALFQQLARECAAEAGFRGFQPDTCLLNRYEPGAKLTLHQDKEERDLRQPIVSVSLGLPAVFLFGGFERGDATLRVLLEHGDVVVWGGPARLRYHGILPVKAGIHPQAGAFRYNLTFRRAH